MKTFDMMLNFSTLTTKTTAGNEKINAFKFFLDNENIKHNIHVSNDFLQVIFKELSISEYIKIKEYYYNNIYNNNCIYDINDVMFMSYNNMIDKISK